jgi:hypothetical protein
MNIRIEVIAAKGILNNPKGGIKEILNKEQRNMYVKPLTTIKEIWKEAKHQIGFEPHNEPFIIRYEKSHGVVTGETPLYTGDQLYLIFN